MYDSFFGKIISISDSFIILELNNIGYKIFLTNTQDIKLNYYIRIYIYNHVTDSINQLYGFKSKIERDIFTKLIEVKKIGVKSAFVILRKYSSEELLSLISSNDIDSILKIPKITKENYKSLIQKLSGMKLENSININIEFLSILRSLEYKDQDIFKVYKKIDTNKDINNQVKDAIRLLEGSSYE